MTVRIGNPGDPTDVPVERTTPGPSYRYWLARDVPGTGGILGWLMLNPSTADDRADDPTIRRCKGFTAHNGYSGIRVANLYPLRATDPSRLHRATEAERLGDAVEADAAIRRLCVEADVVVLAWGAEGRRYRERVGVAWALVRQSGKPIRVVEQLADGTPRHPLMAAYGPLIEVRGTVDAGGGW